MKMMIFVYLGVFLAPWCLYVSEASDDEIKVVSNDNTVDENKLCGIFLSTHSLGARVRCNITKDATSLKCRIYCPQYNENSEVQFSYHECDNGKWNAPLPHCVVGRLESKICMIPLSSQAKGTKIKCKSTDANSLQCEMHCPDDNKYNPEIHNNSYICNDGEWNPYLPHCAVNVSEVIDCKIKLISAGRKQCRHDHEKTSKICRISCYSENDLPEVPPALYTCRNEIWTPDLPHCIRTDKTNIETYVLEHSF